MCGTAHGQSLPEREWGEPWNGVGYGVRAIGLGGAYVAIADDFDGAYWNPGGLVRMRDTQIGVVTGDAAWSRRYTTRAGMSTLPYMMGLGFVTSAFKPWAAGLNVVRSLHTESLLPWQDDYYMGTFVLPLNAARTAGFGVNVKYMYSDYWYNHPFVGMSLAQDAVTGWAVDMGFYYSIPMPLRDRRREVNIGVVGRNIVGQSRVVNTQRTLPSQASMGMSFVFDDLVPRERSLVTIEYDQALRTTLGNLDTQVRMGFEQWFFQNNAGVRFGYATPFPRWLPEESRISKLNPVVVEGTYYSYMTQGRPVWAGGVTLALFSVQVNVGVTVPAEQAKAEKLGQEPETPVVKGVTESGTPTVRPVDKVRFYLSVLYRVGAAVSAPYAKISVEPLVFAPKKGEAAVFTIDYRDERGIEYWAVEIKNSARVPVRTYTGRGSPPERLAWDGLDDRFNLAPDDDHTYTLTVRNRDRVETITAPQSLRVFTPGEVRAPNPDLTPLQKLNEEEAAREAAGKAAVKPLINLQMRGMKEAFGGSTGGGTAPGAEEGMPGLTPVAPVAPSATVSEAPGGATPYATFRGIAAGKVVRVEVPAVSGGGMVVEYETEQTVLKYLIREVKSLTEQSYGSVGPTAGKFTIQARWGSHVLVAETPMEVVRGMREGRLDEGQWVRAARIELDARPIEPDLR
jgi:hypothetical protein